MDGLLESPKEETFVKKMSLVSLILSIVFLITSVVFAMLFFTTKGATPTPTPTPVPEVDPVIPSESLIPINGPVDGQIAAAAGYKGKLNIQPSPYYRHLNFYNGTLPKTLHILPKFKTYQQTNAGTCGAAASLMVLTFYNESEITEASLAEETLRYPNTTPDKIVEVFKKRGYTTISSEDSESLHWKDGNDFYKDLVAWIDKKIPILVKLGGHWSVIIGYDDFGNEGKDDGIQNHVLVLADSWDSHDHQQDGYIIYTFDYFWNLWTNMAVNIEGKYQQFVVGYKESQ